MSIKAPFYRTESERSGRLSDVHIGACIRMLGVPSQITVIRCVPRTTLIYQAISNRSDSKGQWECCLWHCHLGRMNWDHLSWFSQLSTWANQLRLDGSLSRWLTAPADTLWLSVGQELSGHCRVEWVVGKGVPFSEAQSSLLGLHSMATAGLIPRGSVPRLRDKRQKNVAFFWSGLRNPMGSFSIHSPDRQETATKHFKARGPGFLVKRWRSKNLWDGNVL